MATPKITWGASFANTWTFPGPIDNPRPVQPKRTKYGESQSGVRTSWSVRTDAQLAFMVGLIPKANSGSVTGYSTASTGVREALAWMCDNDGTNTTQNQFRFYPDKDVASYHTCYLIGFDPERDVKRHLPGGSHYDVEMVIRDTSGTAFSEY